MRPNRSTSCIVLGALALLLVPATAAADDPISIDVLVVYTDDARQFSGGTAAIEAEIDLVVSQTNDAYANSNVDHRIRLVHTAEVQRNESGDTFTELWWITSNAEVAALRDQYDADIVSFIINSGTNAGMSWSFVNADNAYNVVRRIGFSILIFPHELGHNMGSDHEHGREGVFGAQPYARAHSYVGDSGTTRYTIMYSATAARIPHFSNPDILYDGQPTGVPVGESQEAHNARSLNELASYIAGYRDAAPTATFTASIDVRTATFDASASSDSEGTTLSYAWDFGDGTTGAGIAPSHMYAANGTYPVILTVTDGGGNTAEGTSDVTIDAGIGAAIAFDAEGTVFDFDGSGSSSPDGAIVAWGWDFGDGTTASGSTMSHAYAAPGRYTVSLIVEDNTGATATSFREVFALAPFVGVPGNSSWLDLDGANATGGDLSVDFAWDLGDGNTATGSYAEHQYGSSGPFMVVLSVSEGGVPMGAVSGTPYVWTSVKTPDFDQNATINIIDILAMKPVFGTSAGDGIYQEKYDLNSDGTINIIDILAMKPVFGRAFHTRFPIPGW